MNSATRCGCTREHSNHIQPSAVNICFVSQRHGRQITVVLSERGIVLAAAPLLLSLSVSGRSAGWRPSSGWRPSGRSLQAYTHLSEADKSSVSGKQQHRAVALNVDCESADIFWRRKIPQLDQILICCFLLKLLSLLEGCRIAELIKTPALFGDRLRCMYVKFNSSRNQF